VAAPVVEARNGNGRAVTGMSLTRGGSAKSTSEPPARAAVELLEGRIAAPGVRPTEEAIPDADAFLALPRGRAGVAARPARARRALLSRFRHKDGRHTRASMASVAVMSTKAATPWGSAIVVEELRLQQRAGEKRFSSIVQLLEDARGERLVRFAYATDGTARRGPVTLRARDLEKLRAALADTPELAAALGLG